MALPLPPLNLLGLFVSLVGVGLAGFVFHKGPRRSVNRRLALLLTVVVADLFTSAAGPSAISSRATQAAVTRLHFIVDASLPPLYLLFIASALDTPATRILRKRSVERALAVLALAAPLLVLVVPEGLRLGDQHRVPYLFAWVAAGFLSAFAIALHAYLSAPQGPRRRTLGSYLAAFGVLDLSWSFVFVATGLNIGGLIDLSPAAQAGIFYLYTLAPLVFAALLTYGILRTQLLDIDLKVKWTLEKSTVAAVFVAVFFAASEAAQVLFADFAGNELLGVLAAGGLVFFLAPLQRFADRVGDAAMPDVEDTEAYREQRKREVYRASVEELMADEEITAKERRMLGRLQEELGLDGGEASRIEADVLAGGGDAA